MSVIQNKLVLKKITITRINIIDVISRIIVNDIDLDIDLVNGSPLRPVVWVILSALC